MWIIIQGISSCEPHNTLRFHEATVRSPHSDTSNVPLIATKCDRRTQGTFSD